MLFSVLKMSNSVNLTTHKKLLLGMNQGIKRVKRSADGNIVSMVSMGSVQYTVHFVSRKEASLAGYVSNFRSTVLFSFLTRQQHISNLCLMLEKPTNILEMEGKHDILLFSYLF
jgi:hypothetical protein